MAHVAAFHSRPPASLQPPAMPPRTPDPPTPPAASPAPPSPDADDVFRSLLSLRVGPEKPSLSAPSLDLHALQPPTSSPLVSASSSRLPSVLGPFLHPPSSSQPTVAAPSRLASSAAAPLGANHGAASPAAADAQSVPTSAAVINSALESGSSSVANSFSPPPHFRSPLTDASMPPSASDPHLSAFLLPPHPSHASRSTSLLPPHATTPPHSFTSSSVAFSQPGLRAGAPLYSVADSISCPQSPPLSLAHAQHAAAAPAGAAALHVQVPPQTQSLAGSPLHLHAAVHHAGAQPQTRASAHNAPRIKNDLYKTEICRTFAETGGFCKYGAKCQFAHGEAELRPVRRHPRYKTKLCRNYTSTGSCPYDARCRFIHAPASFAAAFTNETLSHELIEKQHSPSSSAQARVVANVARRFPSSAGLEHAMPPTEPLPLAARLNDFVPQHPDTMRKSLLSLNGLPVSPHSQLLASGKAVRSAVPNERVYHANVNVFPHFQSDIGDVFQLPPTSMPPSSAVTMNPISSSSSYPLNALLQSDTDPLASLYSLREGSSSPLSTPLKPSLLPSSSTPVAASGSTAVHPSSASLVARENHLGLGGMSSSVHLPAALDLPTKPLASTASDRVASSVGFGTVTPTSSRSRLPVFRNMASGGDSA